MQLDMRRKVTETWQKNLDERKKRLEEKDEEACRPGNGQKTSQKAPADQQGAACCASRS